MMYPQMYNPYITAPAVRGIQYVNGLDSAKMYQMAPNQEALLMDSNAPVFYLKTTDAAGQFSIKEYEFKERVHPDPRQEEFDAINERLQRLEFMISSLKEANNEPITSKPTDKSTEPV